MILDIIKSIFLGIIEGITEWLPISSTGHLILFNDLMGIDKDSFFNSQMFLYVIQLGAILAVVTLYFNKLFPFSPKKSVQEKKDTWNLLFKIIVAIIPAGVFGLLLNDFMDSLTSTYLICAMLILYGIAFLFVNTDKKCKINSVDEIDYKTALLIGLFQVLAIVPGTSRSGATILGGILIGCSRGASAEFSFFLAIPLMVGISIIKIITNDVPVTNFQWILLAISSIVSYVVSLISVKFLVNYVKKHNFKLFGWYRIILGILVLLYFLLIK